MVNKTRILCEGAMMVALVGVMLFVNRQFANMIEYVMYWILTFPILVYTAKYGVRYGILTSACMMLLSFIIATPSTMFYLFCCIVMGLVYGYGIGKSWKNGILLVLTGIAVFISYVITTIVFAGVFGYSPSEDIEMVHMLMGVFHMNETSINMAQFIPSVVILLAVVMSVLQTICIHMIANILLKRLHINVREMKTLFEIHVKQHWGIVIIIIWVLYLSRNVLKLNQEVSTMIIILFLCAFLFALSYGVLTCMVKCIVTKKRKLVFLVMLLAFIPYVQQVIAMIGILDILFSLRDSTKRGVIHG